MEKNQRAETCQKNKDQEAKLFQIFLGGLAQKSKEEELRDIISKYAKVIKIDLLEKKDKKKMCVGHAILTTDCQGATDLLKLQSFTYLEKNIIMSRYLTGSELEDHKFELQERTIYILKIPQDKSKKYDSLETFYTEFNSQFGPVESIYARKMPVYDETVYVLVFFDKESRSKALEYFIGQEKIHGAIQVVKDIHVLRYVLYDKRFQQKEEKPGQKKNFINEKKSKNNYWKDIKNIKKNEKINSNLQNQVKQTNVQTPLSSNFLKNDLPSRAKTEIEAKKNVKDQRIEKIISDDLFRIDQNGEPSQKAEMKNGRLIQPRGKPMLKLSQEYIETSVLNKIIQVSLFLDHSVQNLNLNKTIPRLMRKKN